MLAADTIHTVDAREGLKDLDDDSIDCVLTSPPYWMTRDYSVPTVRWGDGTESVLGLEADCSAYVGHLLEVFDHVRRVLKTSGTLWINIGDSYGGQSTTASHARHARGSTSVLREDISYMPAKGHVRGRWSKCLMGVPERLVLGMLEHGWILRNRIVWYKPNHMPSSVKDRFASSWEHLLFFTKSPRYYFDLDAVRVPHTSLTKRPNLMKNPKPRQVRASPSLRGVHLPPNPGEEQSLHPHGRNPGDYWPISPETRTAGAILGMSGVVKVPGGAGWAGHVPGGEARIMREQDERWLPPRGKNPGDAWEIATNATTRLKSYPERHQVPKGHFAIFPEKLCERPILAGSPHGGLVLDPFCGSGTTCVVAKRLERHFIGFEINPSYVQLANIRLSKVLKRGGVAEVA